MVAIACLRRLAGLAGCNAEGKNVHTGSGAAAAAAGQRAQISTRNSTTRGTLLPLWWSQTISALVWLLAQYRRRTQGPDGLSLMA